MLHQRQVNIVRKRGRGDLIIMALPTGVEPVACPLGGDRSILLSYGSFD